MSHNIKVSKPISLESTRSEVFEFSPVGPKVAKDLQQRAKTLVFLNRGHGEAWKTQQQRDHIFSTIWATEQAYLKDRTVIEVYGLSPNGEYEYSYHNNGSLIRSTVLLDRPQNPLAPGALNITFNPAIIGREPSPKPEFYKVQELSLRQFQQVKLSNAIIEFLKSAIELLATPFSYLYRLIAGSGEPRAFAAMLIPVEHDRVGAVNHDVVLSQMQFMSHLFASSDPVVHGKGLGLKPSEQLTIWFQGQNRLYQETKKNVQQTPPATYTKARPTVHTEDDAWSVTKDLLVGIVRPYESWSKGVVAQASKGLEDNKATIMPILQGFLKQQNFNQAWNELTNHIDTILNVLLSEDKKNYAAMLKEKVLNLKEEFAYIHGEFYGKVKSAPEGAVLKNVPHYKMWIEGSKRIANPNFRTMIRNPNYRKANADGKVDSRKQIEDLREEVWEKQEPLWLAFNKTDPILQTESFKTKLTKSGQFKTDSWNTNRVEILFFDEWLELPQDHQLIQGNRTTISTPLLGGEESNPTVLSGAQQVGLLFSEGHALGNEMYQAINSGNKSRADACIKKLVAKITDLPNAKHLILPLAQGEGRDYVPHFLVFTYEENKDVYGTVTGHRVWLKHLCFSSTSLDKGKMQVVTNYEITDTFNDAQSVKKFARSLFKTQAYSRSKDSKEVKLKGPMVADHSLDSLLLNFGEMKRDGSVEKKSSRDPVKALFAIAKQLTVQESHLASENLEVLERITASKGHFYINYVNHLISYYEANESRLGASERAHALDGILWYANQVRHYMEKEVDVDTALAISENLMEFVETKLAQLKRAEAMENADVSNLKNKVNLFEASLAHPLEEILTRTEASIDVEGSRVSVKEWADIMQLRGRLEKTDLQPAQRKQVLTDFRGMLRRADSYLQGDKNPIAAKTLLLGLMQAVPPADDPKASPPDEPTKFRTFWDTLEEDEISDWITVLGSLARRMMDASLRTGSFPLKPHEVFEFNVVIPLTQRYLLQRLLPYKIEKIEGDDGILNTYKSNPQTIQQLENARMSFIKMRETEIEQEVTEELKEKWENEDEADAEKLREYKSDVRQFRSDLKAWEDNQKLEVRLRKPLPHPGSEPAKPIIRSAEQKKTERAKELKDEIARRKAADGYLRRLKDIDVSSFDHTWDAWIGRGCDRTQAVMGCFARIMGIPKALYAYRLLGQAWVGNSFASRESTIWLMQNDCSVLVGSSPAFESRYAACKRNLQGLSNVTDDKHALAANLIIGYDQLGDGTQLEDKEKDALKNSIVQGQAGFFNAGEGGNSLAPEEVAIIQKVDAMRRILRDPVTYLKPYSGGGWVGAVRGLLGDERLNDEVLRKKFAAMTEIHLVATVTKDIMGTETGCFTLSKNEREPGSLATTNQAEQPATHLERQKYMGQITPEMAAEKVGADHEREKIDDVLLHRLYNALDPAQEFVLRESALTQSGSPEKEQELSYLAISQCMHFIYQYPDKLEIAQVQHTLYKTFFQQGLIKQHLKKNPEFFVRFGKVLNEVCIFLQKKQGDHIVSELFIREVCERIRRQADALEELSSDMKKQISAALPAYDEDSIVGVFQKQLGSRERERELKVFATFALSYYCHNRPAVTDTDRWTTLLNAFYLMQKSPVEMGHSGLQAELLYTVQKDLLPRIAISIVNGSEGRNGVCSPQGNTLLEKLTGKVGNWQVSEKNYCYTLKEGEKQFEVDLRTGKGFKIKLITGERCKLPEQIRTDDNYQFLFKNLDPMVFSKAGDNGIVDYTWQDQKTSSEFIFRYRQGDRTLQILQVVKGKRYQFQKIDLTTKAQAKIWQLFARHNNKTIEDLIKAKGVWICCNDDGTHDTSKVMLAQHGWNLEKDPITLNIKDKKIVDATVGKGKEKLWVCSGLNGRDSKLLSFRSGGGLLMLSKDKTHVHEIRFPMDPITKEQLILQRRDEKGDVWVVSGREEWVWQLTHTATYEHRFGKNWREYILPLKNPRTGEEEVWIFPHLAIGGEKRGGDVKFLKTAVDFFDVLGAQISNSGVANDLPMEDMRAMLGAAEGFMGDLDTMVTEGSSLVADAVRGQGMQVNQSDQDSLVNMFKTLTAPRGIRYRVDRRSETSSHAGFFYLAYVASLRGDWGAASRYVQLMLEKGDTPSVEDLKQLSKMSMVILGADLLKADPSKTEQFLAPKSPLDAAFRAKLAAALLALNSRLKAQHGLELLSSDMQKKGIAIGGAAFYLAYKKGLPTHYQQLKDHGLLITKREEELVASDVKMIAAAVALQSKTDQTPSVKTTAAPIQFDLPRPHEMEAMVKTMAEFVQPHGVWSIHDLHKEHGSYPKWETVLANFWSYWEWIYQNDLSVEDIAFLLREMPPLKPGAKKETKEHWEAIHTARRTLLLFWHYCKNPQYGAHRTRHDIAEEAILREIKNARLEMPDFASMETKKRNLKQEAEMNPGILRAAYAEGYKWYVTARRKFNEFTWQDEVGGVKHERGLKKDFVAISNELLLTFLAEATKYNRDSKLMIHPDMLAPEDVAARLKVPKPVKKVDPLEGHKEAAFKAFVKKLKSFGPEGAQLTDQIKGGEIKEIFSTLLDLDDTGDKLVSLILMTGSAGADLSPGDLQAKIDADPEGAVLFGMLKQCYVEAREYYAAAAGLPKSLLPKEVEGGQYERVEVQPSKVNHKWDQYFVETLQVWSRKAQTWVQKESIWEKRKALAKAYFDPNTALSPREKFTLEKKCAGIDKATDELKERTGQSFNVTALKVVYNTVSANIKELEGQNKKLRVSVIEFARRHAQELGIMHLFADRGSVSEEQVIQKIFDMYRYGQLGRLDNEQQQTELAELVTEAILIATEMQQYKKAKETCKSLAHHWQEIQKKIPSSIDKRERDFIAQSIANGSVDWLLHSAELKRSLEEGANRLRYTEEIDGRHCLKDQKFTRRYLVSDVRNEWISRKKATKSLEDLLNDMVEKGGGQPVRFIKAKMGTGKSDFIFPEAIDLLLQRGYEPAMITTDDLVDQLKISMGHKAFVFKFSIDFGLDKIWENELSRMGEDQRKQTWAKLMQPNSIKSHLQNMVQTLDSLQADGKAILTSPSQVAALRDKRVQLQGMLSMMNPGPERTVIFDQLQLVKKIEAHFKKEETIYLVDEDVNFDIAFEYNFATGEYRTVDPIRFDIAEHLIRTIKVKHPALWTMIVENNLRAIRDVSEEFKEVARTLFRDIEFWKTVGWKEEDWKGIDENEFIGYILGSLDEKTLTDKGLPKGMPKWNPKLADDKQQAKAYVAALKTFLSKTLDSVKGVNPKLERGISSYNGVTTVPYSDGSEKPGVLYGEESENILHHFFHYAGAGNFIGEEIFRQKFKDLSTLDMRISPLYTETWKSWGDKIGKVYAAAIYDPETGKGYKDHYDAFIGSSDLALERLQFLRHLMLETDFIRVYHEQITFNSQDLGIGVDVRVGSGTGQPFALNLSDYTEDSAHAPDVVLGETLLCLDLEEKTTTFETSPLDYIEKKAKDESCQAILNFDYEVLGNNCEKLAARLRTLNPDRQMIYRVEEDQQLVKKIWNPGEHFFPMGYEAEAISRDKSLFLYSRRDGRGVHFHVPKGGDKYGEVMFGVGNQEDSMAQLVWRLRHLDMGHHVQFSHDKKTELQIREVCKNRKKGSAPIIKDGEQPTIGHAMRYFTLNTINDEDVKNVKASIFKEQTPLKTYLDEEVRKPYNLRDIDNTAILEEVEGKAVCKATKALYIMTNKNRWVREYQAHKTTDPITFITGLCEDELKKIELMDKQFEGEMRTIVRTQDQAQMVKKEGLLNWSPSSTDPEKFEKELSDFLNPRPAPVVQPPPVVVAPPVAAPRTTAPQPRPPAYTEEDAWNDTKNLLVNMARGYESSKPGVADMAAQGLDNSKDSMMPILQAFAPPPVAPPPVVPMTAMIWADRYSPQDIAVAREIVRKYQTIRFGFRKAEQEIKEEQKRLADPEYRQFLINNLPQNISVDLDEGARNEQKIQQLQEQKREQKQEKVERVMIPARGDEPTAPINFDHFKAVAIGERTIVKDFWSNYQWERNGNFLPLNTALQQELHVTASGKEYDNIYVSQRAWKMLHKMGRNGAPAVELLVIEDKKGVFHSVVITPAEREETVAKAMIQERHENAAITAVSKKAKNNSGEHIAVYPLSNENFSRMIMDVVVEPNDKSNRFTHMMVMNKLFLNWCQFTLEEIDCLISYVEGLDTTSARSFTSSLSDIHGQEKYRNLETGLVETRNPQTAELIKRIRNREPEWALVLAMRKWNANYTRYNPAELMGLEKWVASLRSNEYMVEQQRLRTNGASNSLALLDQLREKANQKKS